jgi:hypothetical protein
LSASVDGSISIWIPIPLPTRQSEPASIRRWSRSSTRRQKRRASHPLVTIATFGAQPAPIRGISAGCGLRELSRLGTFSDAPGGGGAGSDPPPGGPMHLARRSARHAQRRPPASALELWACYSGAPLVGSFCRRFRSSWDTPTFAGTAKMRLWELSVWLVPLWALVSAHSLNDRVRKKSSDCRAICRPFMPHSRVPSRCVLELALARLSRHLRRKARRRFSLAAPAA